MHPYDSEELFRLSRDLGLFNKAVERYKEEEQEAKIEKKYDEKLLNNIEKEKKLINNIENNIEKNMTYMPKEAKDDLVDLLKLLLSVDGLKEDMEDDEEDDEEDEDEEEEEEPRIQKGDCFTVTINNEPYEVVYIETSRSSEHFFDDTFDDYNLIGVPVDKKSINACPRYISVPKRSISDLSPIVNLHYVTLPELAEMLTSFESMKLIATAEEEIYSLSKETAIHLFIEVNGKIIHIMQPHTKSSFDYFYTNTITYDELEEIRNKPSIISYKKINRKVDAIPMTAGGLFDFFKLPPAEIHSTIIGVDLDFVLIYDFGNDIYISQYGHGIKNIFDN